MAITVDDVYAKAKALMYEKSSSTIYDDYLIPNLNVLLVELFAENNALRVFRGKELLDEPQQVISRTDELEYEDKYLLEILPKGLAAAFCIDDDLNKYSIFSTLYNNARVSNLVLVSKEQLDAA